MCTVFARLFPSPILFIGPLELALLNMFVTACTTFFPEALIGRPVTKLLWNLQLTSDKPAHCMYACLYRKFSFLLFANANYTT